MADLFAGFAKYSLTKIRHMIMISVYIFLLSLSLFPLILFWRINGDSLRLERFYYHTNKHAFYVLQGTVMFLLLSLAIYTRLIITDLFEYIPFVKYMRKAVARGKL